MLHAKLRQRHELGVAMRRRSLNDAGTGARPQASRREPNSGEKKCGQRHGFSELRSSYNSPASVLITSSRNRIPNEIRKNKYRQQFQETTKTSPPAGNPPPSPNTREARTLAEKTNTLDYIENDIRREEWGG